MAGYLEKADYRLRIRIFGSIIFGEIVDVPE